MAIPDIQNYIKLLPSIMQTPDQNLHLSYDHEADTLYINFQKSRKATDSELTDDDIIVRYDNEEIIGITVLHASRR